MREIAVETPGFQTYRHGHHHEFELVELSFAAETLLGTCFCPACRTRARDEGLDAEALARHAQAALDGFLADGTAAIPDLLADPDWAGLTACRARTVTTLVAELREALPREVRLAVIPSVQTPNSLCWREGSDLAALASVADRLEVPAYQQGAEAIAADIADVRLSAGDAAAVGFIFRPTWPHVSGPKSWRPVSRRPAPPAPTACLSTTTATYGSNCSTGSPSPLAAEGTRYAET